MQYIPAFIEGYSKTRIMLNNKIDKRSLRSLPQDQLIRATDFRSLSEFHQEGRKFTLNEAYAAYGDVSIEVREGNDCVAIIEYNGKTAVVR